MTSKNPKTRTKIKKKRKNKPPSNVKYILRNLGDVLISSTIAFSIYSQGIIEMNIASILFVIGIFGMAISMYMNIKKKRSKSILLSILSSSLIVIVVSSVIGLIEGFNLQYILTVSLITLPTVIIFDTTLGD